MKNISFIIRPFENTEVESFHTKVILPMLDELGFIPKRADQLPPKEQILERIIHAIEDALLILCDLSDLNPNVMYELGIAHSLTRRVIMICNTKTILPFDLKDYEVLLYNSSDFDYSKFRIRFKEMVHSVNKYGLDNPVQRYSKQNNVIMDVKIEKVRRPKIPANIIHMLINHIKDNINCKKPFVISVSGAAGLGKTTFVNQISKYLLDKYKISSSVISLDGYMLTRNEIINRKTSGYCKEAHDIFKMKYDLIELINNKKTIDVPFFDHGTGIHSSKKIRIEYQDVILLDGVMSFCEEIKEFVDLKVFLEAKDRWVNMSLRFLVNLEQRNRTIRQSLDTSYREYNYYVQYLHSFSEEAELVISVGKDWDMEIKQWGPFDYYQNL